MNKDLVSIITPCFNMEKTVARLMDSIIRQSYRPIEFILVDDGSTDQSYEIAKSYESRFKEGGIIYKLYHQENQGLGGAINAGLSLVTGEYICWPDADDYLESDSVQERVNALKHHPECAVVTSNAYIRDAENLNSSKLLVDCDLKKHEDPNQFLYHLNAESIFCPGCHMVKAEDFFKVNPDHCIYPARRGQNWQMLLPLYYSSKRYFLNKPLYNYIVYADSMSKGDNDYESFLFRFNEHEQILRETLKKIEKVQNVDITEYSRFLDDKYAKLRMELAIKYSKPDVFIQEYRRKQIDVGLDLSDVFNYVRSNYPLLNKPLSIIYRIIRGRKTIRYPGKAAKKIKKKYCENKVGQS